MPGSRWQYRRTYAHSCAVTPCGGLRSAVGGRVYSTYRSHDSSYLITLLAAVALLAACGRGTRLPDRAPDIQGIITQVDSTNRPFPRVLVEVNPDAFDNSNKSWVSITDESLLYRRDGSTLQQATFSDVQTQQQVTVWFSGPVLQSYPSQSGAEVLVIDRP